MGQNGDYPFKVTIINKFNQSQGIAIQAEHYYVPLGVRCDEIKDVSDLLSNTITIEPGEKITFPLYCGEEYLSLSVPQDSSIEWPSLPDQCYYIWADVKAKIYPDDTLEDHGQYTPSPEGSFIDAEGITFYCGGTWKIDESAASWALDIKKYSPDPEEDDVVVGPDTPG